MVAVRATCSLGSLCAVALAAHSTSTTRGPAFIGAPTTTNTTRSLALAIICCRGCRCWGAAAAQFQFHTPGVGLINSLSTHLIAIHSNMESVVPIATTSTDATVTRIGGAEHFPFVVIDTLL